MAHVEDHANTPYRSMILQYSEILDFYWLSKVKHHFISNWQQWFYDPLLASVPTKHTVKWKTTTTEMITEMTTEMKMETAIIMLLPGQDLMVWSLIQSWRLGMIEEDQMMTVTRATDRSHYISTILNMVHKLMYAKFRVLDWCQCHKKIKPS